MGRSGDVDSRAHRVTSRRRLWWKMMSEAGPDEQGLKKNPAFILSEAGARRQLSTGQPWDS